MCHFKSGVQKVGHRGISNHLFLLLGLHVELALLFRDFLPCFGDQVRDQANFACVLVDFFG